MEVALIIDVEHTEFQRLLAMQVKLQNKQMGM